MQPPRVFSLDPEGKRVKALERLLQNNLSAREKHADAPRQFLDSEVALDDAINEFGQLSANPAEIRMFMNQRGFEILASIIDSHANPDVAQSAVNVIGEIVDPENFNLEESTLAVDAAKHLIDELKWFSLMKQHLSKFTNLNEELDHEAVASTLQCISHTMGLAMMISVPYILTEEALIDYLFEQTRSFDDIALYACDILADISAFLLADNASEHSNRLLTDLGSKRAPAVLGIVQEEVMKGQFTSVESKEVVLTLLDCLLHYTKNDATCVAHDSRSMPLLLTCYQNAPKELHEVACKFFSILLSDNESNCNLFVEKNNLRRLFGDLREAASSLQEEQLLLHVQILHALVFNCTNESLSRVISRLVDKGMSTFSELMSVVQSLSTRMSEVEAELVEELRADSTSDLIARDWLTSPTSMASLTADEVAMELALCELSEISLKVIGLMCQMVTRLSGLGDKKLKLGIHVYMKENTDTFTAFQRNYNRLKCFHPERVVVEGQSFQNFIDSHQAVIDEAEKVLMKLREEASFGKLVRVVGGVTFLLASEAAAKQDQMSKTERNRETRQKHKIRRMDAEMKRLQGIEDARYARKKQLR